MSKNQARGSHVGSASILLIFTVLSIISFATLTLVNSKADYNLSDNLAQRQASYYAACHRANALVAAVDAGFEAGAQDGIIKESIPITDNQSLDISILTKSAKNSINSDKSDNILQWQVVNHGDYDYDTTLPVMK